MVSLVFPFFLVPSIALPTPFVEFQPEVASASLQLPSIITSLPE